MISYRKDIDCLRGYSVLAVIFYHLKFPFFSGGYLGVDIFFVISGYLISLLLFKSIQDNSFSLINFYQRRIRRIIPALYFVIIISTIIQLPLLLPDDKINFFKIILSILFLSSNYFFYKSGSYFDPINEDEPFIHTWSLSLEEQFYFIFPLLLFFYKKNYIRILIIIFFFSLLLANNGGVFSFNYPYFDNFAFVKTPGFGFYFLFTRVWEFLVGSFLAIYVLKKKKYIISSCYYFSYLGYIIIFFSFILFEKNIQHPSVYTLVPVIGAALIILFGSQGKKNAYLRGIINNKFILYIGLISYSLYLWHLPVYNIFYNFYGPLLITNKIKILLFIITFAVSIFSYVFIEKSFRNKSFINNRWLVIIFFITTFSGILITIINIYYVDYKKNLDDKLIKILSEPNYYKNMYFEKCLSGPDNYIHPNKACVLGDNLNLDYAFIGDSHMAILSKELSNELKKIKKGGHLLTYNGCLPALGLKILDKRKFLCDKYYDDVFNFIKENNNLKTVILFYRWPIYFSGKLFDNMEGGVEIGKSHVIVPKNANKLISESDRIWAIDNSVSDYINKIIELDKKIIIISSIPEMGWEIPKFLAKKIMRNNYIDINYLSIDKKIFIERNREAKKFLDFQEKFNNLKIIYPDKVFCDKLRCFAHSNGYPIYYDDDHLSSLGSKILSEIIVRNLR